MFKLFFIVFCIVLSACSKSGSPLQTYSSKENADFRDEILFLLKKEKYEDVYSMLKTKTLDSKDYDLHIYLAVALLRLGFLENSLAVFEKAKELESPQKSENLMFYEDLLYEYF